MVTVRSRPLLLALVAILAISLAAATLDTAVVYDAGVGEGGEGQFGSGSGAGGPSSDEQADPDRFGVGGLTGVFPSIALPCLHFLTERWFLGSALLVVGVGLYLLYRLTDVLVPIAFTAAFGPPVLLVYAVLTACRPSRPGTLLLPFPGLQPNATVVLPLVGEAGRGGAAGGQPVVSLALVGVLGLALLVAVVLLVQATGDAEAPAPDDAPAPDPEQMAAIGRAAGRAADRIEDDADPDNAVYRAWKEMTDRLEVPNPASSTPAEFAAAAVEAGMRREDVDELTSLFETVRYGTAAPTEDRETRAVRALRRIEDAYGGEEP